jgi:2-phospho-L-lactate/phosphoenolpyruvate guanylyltransferase
MILIPVKNLASAKQRLAGVLEQRTRTELAHAMLQDVAEAISTVAGDKTAIVTSDNFAIEVGRSYGFEVIPDNVNSSETDAIEMATRWCEARTLESTLVVPADIPLVESADIEAVLENAPAAGAVLVPSGDGRGTNAVLRRPAASFPLRFGSDSFVPHLAAARRTGNPCVVLDLPRIALDIDTPQDLAELASLPGDRRAQLLARKLGFDSLRSGLSDFSRSSAAQPVERNDP